MNSDVPPVGSDPYEPSAEIERPPNLMSASPSYAMNPVSASTFFISPPLS